MYSTLALGIASERNKEEHDWEFRVVDSAQLIATEVDGAGEEVPLYRTGHINRVSTL